MKTYSQTELDELIRSHEKWLEGSPKGEKANVSRGSFEYLDFKRANLREASFVGCFFNKVNMAGVNLTSANLDKSELTHVGARNIDLSNARIANATLLGGYFNNANFRMVYAKDTRFINTQLNNAAFTGADIRYSDFRFSDLEGAIFDNANLKGVIGDTRFIKTLYIEAYSVTYTHDRLAIGCKNYKIKTWFSLPEETQYKIFNQEQIALWKKWKPILKKIIKMSPAEKPIRRRT